MKSVHTVATFLRGEGHEVVITGTAAAALEYCNAHMIDLLISDVELPDVSGWELLRRVRNTCPAKAIALSAYARAIEAERSLSSGFDAHLAKPFDFPILVATLDRVLSG
jgi:two-component system CheB/CheR fusion protein